MVATNWKWVRVQDGSGVAKYQSPQKCGTGIGRFQVKATDNANARAIGRQPKWTVTDLYTLKRFQGDNLAECREWAQDQEAKS